MTSLAAQIDEARRELALRERVYPRYVRDGRMTEAQRIRRIETMRDILATLERLYATENPTLL